MAYCTQADILEDLDRNTLIQLTNDAGVNGFQGSGLNDISFAVTGLSLFEIVIDAQGSPDTFKWRVDGGDWTEGVSITGLPQILTGPDGNQIITFAAITGHTTGDSWTIGIVSDVISAKIADADAEIDGYCGTRYSVPFATVPPVIQRASVVISIKNLYGRKRGAGESRRKDYDDVIRFLKDVAAGRATLGENDPDSTPSASNAPDIDSPDRIFSRENMTGF
jgi:phage gp36-like protein